MFDGSDPDQVRRHTGWAVGPLSKLDVAQTGDDKRLALQLGRAERYGMVHDGDVYKRQDKGWARAPSARPTAEAI